MKTEGQEGNTLNDFTGFTAENLDFFGENSTGTSIDSENLLEAVKNDNPVVDPKEKEKETDKVDIAEVFDWEGTDKEDSEEEDSEEDEVSNLSPKKEKSTPAVINSKSTLDFLKSKGFVEYELPEGKTELTEAEAEELLEDSWEASLDSAIAETVQDLDPIAKAILKVAKDGGDVRGMIRNLATNLSVGIDKTTDMTQENNQVLAVTLDLKEQGFDDEYISTHIETLKTTEKLEAMSKKSSERIVAKQEAAQTAAVEASNKAALKNKENQRAYKNNLVNHLGENKTIEGVTVNKKEVDIFASYIADPTVLLENGSTVSELQKDLFAAMADKNNLFLLAKMLKGKNGKLDFSFVANKAVTEFSNNVRNNIQNTEDTPVTRSSSGSSRKRSLADHF
jgi:hypothetical protein